MWFLNDCTWGKADRSAAMLLIILHCSHSACVLACVRPTHGQRTQTQVGLKWGVSPADARAFQATTSLESAHFSKAAEAAFSAAT